MTSVIVSHGADFFGEDHHLLKVLTSLAGYAEGVLPAADRTQLVTLLQSAGTPQTVPAAQAARLAPQFLAIARHGFVRSKTCAQTARMLADAATRAAADNEPWTWNTTTN